MPLVIPLLAALPDILFVLLVIVFATGLAFFIVPPIVEFIRHLPVFGSALASAAEVAFLAQQAAMRVWVARNVTPVVNLLQSSLSLVGGFFDLFIKLLQANLAAMQATATAAGGQAGNVGQRIIALAGLVAQLVTGLANLTGFANGLWNRVTTLIQVGIPTAIGTAVTALQQLIHVGLAVEHQAMTTAMAQAVQVAQALFTQAQLAAKAGDAVMAELLGHTAATLAAEIVAVQTGAKAYTDGWGRAIDGELQDIIKVAIPAAVVPLAFEITQVATQVDTLERECINPTCSALSAGLDLFQLLQAGVELLMIVTLVGSAISDPERTGHELAQGVDELLGWTRPILSAFGVQV